jgi:glutamate racemase
MTIKSLKLNFMEKFENNKVNRKQATERIFDLIPKIEEVTNIDVENLKKEVSDEAKKTFDKMPEYEKIILACIHYKLSESEINKLLEIAGKYNDNERILGFHRVRGAIQYLINETENEKYNFLRNKDKK